jgi:cytochrome c biogenesis protein CcmG/thiol:disulfide interchange protein DsbE
VPCAAEAPQLAELQREGVPLVGVAVRDQPDDLAAFFQRYGNPFSRVGADKVSQLQFLIGSSGVPETYVVDGRGVIRHQHIGMVRPEDIPDLLARLKDAQG